MSEFHDLVAKAKKTHRERTEEQKERVRADGHVKPDGWFLGHELRQSTQHVHNPREGNLIAVAWWGREYPIEVSLYRTTEVNEGMFGTVSEKLKKLESFYLFENEMNIPDTEKLYDIASDLNSALRETKELNQTKPVQDLAEQIEQAHKLAKSLEKSR